MSERDGVHEHLYADDETTEDTPAEKELVALYAELTEEEAPDSKEYLYAAPTPGQIASAKAAEEQAAVRTKLVVQAVKAVDAYDELVTMLEGSFTREEWSLVLGLHSRSRDLYNLLHDRDLKARRV